MKEKAVPIHRNLAATVRAHLVNRPGQRFQVTQLAKQFDVTPPTMRQTLIGLESSKDGIRSAVSTGKRHWFFPKPERAEVSPAQEVRPYRTYSVPSPMLERMAEIRAEREQYPSFYGDNNQRG